MHILPGFSKFSLPVLIPVLTVNRDITNCVIKLIGLLCTELFVEPLIW